MPVQSNILDEIHNELPPEVWDDPAAAKPHLKPQHRKWIRARVHQVLVDGGYTHMDDWLSLVLTGSLTTYQYGSESDCDVSLFVDAEVFPEWSRAEMIGLMTSKMDGTILPGTSFPMQCFVVPPEVKKEDLYKPGLRSGYDLETDEWVEPPDRTRVHDVKREMNNFYAYALEQADKMERLLRYEPDKAVMLWHQIHKKRRRDQLAGKGDYSESNIVYKFLANRGLFPQISDVSGEYIAKTSAIEVLEAPHGDTGRPPGQTDARAFWYDDDNQKIYLSQRGGWHTDVLNAFNLPFGGMWRAIALPDRIDWMGQDKYLNPGEAEAVKAALIPYFPEYANAANQSPQEKGSWDFSNA